MRGDTWEKLSSRLALAACVAILGGCSSGGGNSAGTPSSPSGGNTGGGGTPNPPASFVTLDQATLGTSPATVQTASATGPDFVSRLSETPAGTVFPLLQTSIKLTSSSVSADSETNKGGTTLAYGAAGQAGLRLSIPALGISDRPVTNQAPLVAAANPDALNNVAQKIQSNTTVLVAMVWPYMLSGQWLAADGTKGTLSEFITGYRTQGAAMPNSGTATYTGTDNVHGYTFQANNSSNLTGNGSVTVDFAHGTVSGKLTNIFSENASSLRSSWNDISFTGTFGAASPSFAGTSSVSSVSYSNEALKSGTQGVVSGEFYGPGAENVGAVWSLSDDKTAAMGTLGASKQAFAVGSPSTPGYGTSPAATVTAAAANNPTFDAIGGSPYASGTFPAMQTALKASAAGIAGAPATDSVTFTDDGTTGVCSGGGTCSGSQFKLDLPSIQMSVSASIPTDFSTQTTTEIQSTSDGKLSLTTYGLSYVTFGTWALQLSNLGTTSDAGSYMAGYVTPAAAMPTTGTAHYAGKSNAVSGTVFVTDGGNAVSARLEGGAQFDADFATGSVTGAFTNIQATPADGISSSFNDVAVNANIASGTSTFSGTTAAASPGNGHYALKPTAAGQISGGFYGPNANELGAVWTLSNGDGSGAAIGTVGALKQ
jgi:hypothetical protein